MPENIPTSKGGEIEIERGGQQLLLAPMRANGIHIDPSKHYVAVLRVADQMTLFKIVALWGRHGLYWFVDALDEDTQDPPAEARALTWSRRYTDLRSELAFELHAAFSPLTLTEQAAAPAEVPL